MNKWYCKYRLRTQKHLTYIRRMRLKVHNAPENQFGRLALWMCTRDRILGGETCQVLSNLVHNLERFGIDIDSMVVWRAFVPQAKQALGGPADYGEIFRTFLEVVHRPVRDLLTMVLSDELPADGITRFGPRPPRLFAGIVLDLGDLLRGCRPAGQLWRARGWML